jgi:hypothetical protein
MLQIGYAVQRKSEIRSRMCLIVSLEGNLMSRMVARTPVSRQVRWNYIIRKQPIPEEEPVMVSDYDNGFFWLIHSGMLDIMLNDVGWDVVDGDLFEFMLRLMVALVVQERRARSLGKQMDAEIKVELREMLMVPYTEVSALNEMIRVAEDEGRSMTFSEACERYIPKEKLIYGDELFRAKEYAAVMDREVLIGCYAEWKKSKLCRILPAVMRETYEKILENDADATQRMMKQDPVWSDWNAQMNSQVHGALGNVPAQKKLKYKRGKSAPTNQALTNHPTNEAPGSPRATPRATPRALPSNAKETKIPTFDDQIATLLSSAAVDQAAEDMYRRSQAETDAFEALNQTRLGHSAGNVQSNLLTNRQLEAPDHVHSNSVVPAPSTGEPAPTNSVAPIHGVAPQEDSFVLPPPQSREDSFVLAPPAADVADVELELELDGIDDDLRLPPPEDFEGRRAGR